jgi:hypothetical protein
MTNFQQMVVSHLGKVKHLSKKRRNFQTQNRHNLSSAAYDLIHDQFRSS